MSLISREALKNFSYLKQVNIFFMMFFGGPMTTCQLLRNL
jgi:hypothetical protein